MVTVVCKQFEMRLCKQCSSYAMLIPLAVMDICSMLEPIFYKETCSNFVTRGAFKKCGRLRQVS